MGFFAIIVDSIFFVGLLLSIGWASLQSSLWEKIGLQDIWFILKLKTWSGIHSYGMKWKRSLPFVWIPTFHSPSRIIQVWVSLSLWQNLQPKMGNPFLFPLHESRFLQKYFYQIIIFVLNWYNIILINMVILKINSVLLKVKNADIMTYQK